MNKNALILAITCLFTTSLTQAKISPYLKLVRGAACAIGALYFGTHAYEWHERAQKLAPESVQYNYAQGRFYMSALASLFLGVSSFAAFEKSFDQLEK